MTRKVCALAAFSAASIVAHDASAYCRTSYCPKNNDSEAVCVPATTDDCGVEVFWAKPCIEYDLSMQASSQISLSDAEEIFATAFSTWEGIDCGGGAHPNVNVTYAGPVACHKAEYNEDRGNANIILFRDDGWPYAGPYTTLALTTVSYDIGSGEIYDADMELNSANVTFTTGDTDVGYDLHSIAQHETGHFLGLAHSHDPKATMTPTYTQGTTFLRTPDDDDVAGLCAVFPPGASDPGCDPTPRHGFSGECGADQPPPSSGGCSTSPRVPDDHGGAIALGLLGLVAIARRRP